MNDFMRHLYEHLITKRKYNKLKIKMDITKEDFEKKVVELNTERRIHQKQREVWEKELITQEEQIIKLKKEIKIIKSKKKEEKKNEEKKV